VLESGRKDGSPVQSRGAERRGRATWPASWRRQEKEGNNQQGTIEDVYNVRPVARAAAGRREYGDRIGGDAQQDGRDYSANGGES
jgi:hypothetical protein